MFLKALIPEYLTDTAGLYQPKDRAEKENAKNQSLGQGAKAPPKAGIFDFRFGGHGDTS